MAEDVQDESQKTEEPTNKRREDARRKGEVANSREVDHWFMILAGTVIVMMFLPATMRDFRRLFIDFIARPDAIPVDSGSLHAMIADSLVGLAMALLPTAAILIAAALAAGLVQNGLIFAPDRLVPKLEKISLGKGAKRLFSIRSLAEFAKGIFKLVIVGAVAVSLMLPEFARLERLTTMEFPAVLAVLQTLAVKLLIGVLAIVSIIAVLDFLFQKFQFLKQMRMSRQEIKDEMKQTEGDPTVRARLRQIRRERAQQRMMQAVPQASVVVTNPTHYAVALQYELDTMPAPMVVAKGIDHLALRIRALAEENDVPVLENPPLAQALYAGVEIGEEIPAEHYKAVAEIIGYVLRLKGKLPRRARR